MRQTGHSDTRLSMQSFYFPLSRLLRYKSPRETVRIFVSLTSSCSFISPELLEQSHVCCGLRRAISTLSNCLSTFRSTVLTVHSLHCLAQSICCLCLAIITSQTALTCPIALSSATCVSFSGSCPPQPSFPSLARTRALGELLC